MYTMTSSQETFIALTPFDKLGRVQKIEMLQIGVVLKLREIIQSLKTRCSIVQNLEQFQIVFHIWSSRIRKGLFLLEYIILQMF